MIRPLAVAILTLAAAIASPGITTHPRHAKAQETPKRTLVLLYTAGAKGQIRSCNCTKFRFGGYGRELTLLKSIRAENDNVLLIEGGDSVEWTGFQAELKTDVIVKALTLLGYDAMVPGEDEIGRSGERLIERFDPNAVPIVCANLFREGEEKPAYAPYLIRATKQGIRVGIIGLLDDEVGRVFQKKEFQHAVRDPLDGLDALVKTVRAESDVVVAVYHGSAEAAEKVAAVDGIDLVLSTHRTGREVPFPAEPTNVVSAPVRKSGRVVLVEAETKANWSLGRIDIELTGTNEIAGVSHSLLYLDRRYDEDPEMVAVYEDYNDKVKRAVLDKEAKFRSDSEALLVKRGLNLDQMRKKLRASPFATAEKCADCHSDIHKSWAASRHAKAMATLEEVHQEFDPECVGCHTTGIMTRGGFRNAKDTPELANVQCEACHGPALAHIETPAKLPAKAGELSCRSCHTMERTPNFDFEKDWEKIRH